MATLKEALQYAKSNPNDPRNVELYKHLKMGTFDQKAAEEGVDISGASQTFKTSLNTGIGFKPTAEFVGDETAIEGGKKAIQNAPKSAFEFAKNVVKAVTNPIETAKALTSLVRGGGAKVAEFAIEQTDIGQQLLQKQNERRIAEGLDPFPTNETGKIQAPENDDLQAINSVGEYFKARYGSIDNFKESAVEDPVGVLADVAGLVSGTGLAIRSAGTVSKVSELTNIGGKVARVGQSMEPLTAATKGVVAATNGTRQLIGNVARDVVPTVTEIQRGNVAKALDLTPGDLRNIKNKTGVDVGDFIIEKGFSGQPDEIIIQLGEYAGDVKQNIRDIIGANNKNYPQVEVPRVKQALTLLDELYGETPGLEDVQSEIRTLLGKDQLSLSDIQRTKELIDDADIIFTRVGDVKSGIQAKGLANVRQEIRRFIEDQVPDDDIRQLNKEVQTSKEIEKAAIQREVSGLTRRKLTSLDLLVGLGGVAAFNPMAGIGIVIGKKVLESPAFRLGVARALKGMPENRLVQMIKDIESKNITQDTATLIKDIYRKATANTGIVIPGLETIQEAITDQSE